MGTRRDAPYIWVTWMTGLMAGDKHCVWAAWFRAHYKYTKRDDPDGANTLSQWRAEHADLVQSRAEELRAQGFTVTTEQENKFVIRGKVATVGGVADIVATRQVEPMDEINQNVTALVEDCKTGQQKESDYWQVVLYLLFLPKAFKALKEHRLAGAVIYPTGTVDQRRLNELNGVREIWKRPVLAGDAEIAKDLVVKWIQRVGGDEEPVRTPSWAECRYCDIADCPDRAEEPVAETTTEEF
jgi:hypothetical protein